MNDDRLAELLHDAVADVEPADRIAEIRARTASPARSAARPGSTPPARPCSRPPPPWRRSRCSTTTRPPTPGRRTTATSDRRRPSWSRRTSSATPRSGDAAVPRVRRGRRPATRCSAALDRIQQPAERPRLPDRRGRRARSRPRRSATAPSTSSSATSDRPASDELAVQQVVYTLQGAAGERLPVRFLERRRAGRRPVDARRRRATCSARSASATRPRATRTTGSFIARGRANSFEGDRAVGDPGRRRRVVAARASRPPTGCGDRLYAVGGRGRPVRARSPAPTRSSR